MTRTIIPGIQETAFPDIEKKIRIVEPYTEWVQIDVTDKTLTTNESFRDPNAFANLKTKVNLEVHLMIKDAYKKADEWITAGFKRIIAQVESDNPDQFVKLVSSGVERLAKSHAEVGLALDGPSPLELLLPYINTVDCVLIMMYKAGPSGQKFQPEQLEKIRILRKMYPNLPIEVDGGTSLETIRETEKAGATRFVATSAIFKSDDIEKAIKRLQGIL